MNKMIITLLDSNIEENIRLAAYLIPLHLYVENTVIVGNVYYKLRINEDEEDAKEIMILPPDLEDEWGWYLYTMDSFIDTDWKEDWMGNLYKTHYENLSTTT